MKRLAILALLSLLLCAPLPPLLAQPTYVTIADNAYTPVSGTVCNGQPHISSPDLITSTANALSAVPTDGGPHDAWHPSGRTFPRGLFERRPNEALDLDTTRKAGGDPGT